MPRPDRNEAAFGRGEAILFALTLFLSAALLFTVQPMFAKMVLPRLGGAPAVWNACLVFYQAALLGGYLYAHLSLKWLGPRRQAILHMGLLALAWVSLPIRIVGGWLPPATTFPAPWLWMLLTVSLGLPFFVVSANAPMLQAWFARTHATRRRDPYFLYAASNLGSLLGLLGYPLNRGASDACGAKPFLGDRFWSAHGVDRRVRGDVVEVAVASDLAPGHADLDARAGAPAPGDVRRGKRR